MAQRDRLGEDRRVDDKYVVRTFYSQGEYHWLPVERTEGDYLVMPDGTRLLDFFDQLYCVNVGQKNPRVVAEIKEALDRYGFVWDLYTTDYKATVAKLIVEDILGPYDWAAKVRFTEHRERVRGDGQHDRAVRHRQAADRLARARLPGGDGRGEPPSTTSTPAGLISLTTPAATSFGTCPGEGTPIPSPAPPRSATAAPSATPTRSAPPAAASCRASWPPSA